MKCSKKLRGKNENDRVASLECVYPYTILYEICYCLSLLKQMTKFLSANLKKMLSPSYIIL